MFFHATNFMLKYKTNAAEVNLNISFQNGKVSFSKTHQQQDFIPFEKNASEKAIIRFIIADNIILNKLSLTSSDWDSLISKLFPYLLKKPVTDSKKAIITEISRLVKLPIKEKIRLFPQLIEENKLFVFCLLFSSIAFDEKVPALKKSQIQKSLITIAEYHQNNDISAHLKKTYIYSVLNIKPRYEPFPAQATFLPLHKLDKLDNKQKPIVQENAITSNSFKKLVS